MTPLEKSAQIDDQLVVMAVYFFRSQAWKLFVEHEVPVVIEDVQRDRRLFASVISSSQRLPLVFVTTDPGGFQLCSQLARPEEYYQINSDPRDIPDTLRVAYDLPENLEAVDRSRLRAHAIDFEKLSGLPLPSFRNCECGCSPWPTNSEENFALLIVLKGLLGIYSVAKDFCCSPRVKAREDALVARVIHELAHDAVPSEPCMLLEAERFPVFEKPQTSRKRRQSGARDQAVPEAPKAPEPAAHEVKPESVTWGFAATIMPAANLETDPELIEATIEELALADHPDVQTDKYWEALTFLNEAAVSEGGKPYYPRLPILCDGKSGVILPADPTHPSVSSARAIWRALISAMHTSGRKPKTLWVGKMQEYSVLSPVLNAMGIELKQVKRLKLANAAASSVAARMSEHVAGDEPRLRKGELLH